MVNVDNPPHGVHAPNPGFLGAIFANTRHAHLDVSRVRSGSDRTVVRGRPVCCVVCSHRSDHRARRGAKDVRSKPKCTPRQRRWHPHCACRASPGQCVHAHVDASVFLERGLDKHSPTALCCGGCTSRTGLPWQLWVSNGNARRQSKRGQGCEKQQNGVVPRKNTNGPNSHEATPISPTTPPSVRSVIRRSGQKTSYMH